MGGYRAPALLAPTARVGVRKRLSAAWMRRVGTWVDTTRVSRQAVRVVTHDETRSVRASALPSLAAPQQGPRAWGLHTLLIYAML